MEDRYLQQLKKGVLELLVLQAICRGPTYGYELLSRLSSCSGGMFTLREGTLYPILYRLEDDGLIEAVWRQESGRAAPRKIYSATEQGRLKKSAVSVSGQSSGRRWTPSVRRETTHE